MNFKYGELVNFSGDTSKIYIVHGKGVTAGVTYISPEIFDAQDFSGLIKFDLDTGLSKCGKRIYHLTKEQKTRLLIGALK